MSSNASEEHIKNNEEMNFNNEDFEEKTLINS